MCLLLVLKKTSYIFMQRYDDNIEVNDNKLLEMVDGPEVKFLGVCILKR